MKKLLSTLSLVAFATAAAGAFAADMEVRSASPDAVKAPPGESIYILQLDAPTVLQRLRSDGMLEGQRPGMNAPVTIERLQRVNVELDAFEDRFEQSFGRALNPRHRYDLALNGFAVRLSAEEARRVAAMDGVANVMPDRLYRLQTDAGPGWLGADRIWSGEGGIDATRGEGIVIGVIDSGINWDHPSFADPGEGTGSSAPNQYDHSNPRGVQLGLCDDPDVLCNDKLIGVYDFVEDDPNTLVVEENNNGFDNGEHGAHTAGTAGGNPGAVTIAGQVREFSGVAPNANIISYRVCFVGDPDDFDDDACRVSDTIAAVNQAIRDEVDVINFSIGGGFNDPWTGGTGGARHWLEAFEAGIFVATSGGNSGPGASTVGLPAAAPWITAVGASTHNRFLGGAVTPLNGGAKQPPDVIFGSTDVEDSVPPAPIVYAGDFGNALCGVGEAELEASCEANTGASNPFAPGTFNGEIVVCDRGTYGRVEKGRNLQLAGAGGMVLANTDSSLQSVVADEHCLPAVHIGAGDGNELREWLDGGVGHTASLSGFQVFDADSKGDVVRDFSSRGPNRGSVRDVLKPNLMAPGFEIIAAGTEGSQLIGLNGTSMASPHVAGAGALLLASNPDLSPAQVASMLELAATDEFARDINQNPQDHFDTGAGRPRLLEAARMGVYLDETAENFLRANPASGGDPKTLNLASMTDSRCLRSCDFTRRIGAFEGGLSWSVSTSGFPEGVIVSVPSSLTIPANGTAQLDVAVDWASNRDDLAQTWFFGKVHIDRPNYPQATMPVSIFASNGELPEEFSVRTAESSGFRDFSFNGVLETQQLSFISGGLETPDVVTLPLVQDPTPSDPFDGSAGAETLLFTLPEGALWFEASLPSSLAVDTDLFMGIDLDGDGRADEDELVCQSISPQNVESCSILRPPAGRWWVLVNNFTTAPNAGGEPVDVRLVSFIVAPSDDSSLIATGPGSKGAFDDIDLRVAWENVNAPPGATLVGAVGIGSSRDAGADIAVIPVTLERLFVETPPTTALRDGADRSFALDRGDSHDGLFIDVPPGVDALDVRVAGASVLENEDLELDLVRVSFDSAFGAAPEAEVPENATPAGSASGSGGAGPRVTISGGVQPGRWYAVVRNTGTQPVSVRVRADLTHSGSDLVDVRGGLFEPSSRPGIAQGFEYTPAGPNRAFLWYTYEEDGSPVWYLAAGPEPDGNRWQAELFRYTNDGATQAPTLVGDVAISMLDSNDAVMSWTLFGVSGSDRFEALSRACPDGGAVSYTGIWSRPEAGLGGASILVNPATQGQIHYLYDRFGKPRWLLGGGAAGVDETLTLLQFSGFPPNGSGSVANAEVGVVDMSYADDAAGSWTLDYLFEAPVTGTATRSDDVIKLSNEIACEQ